MSNEEFRMERPQPLPSRNSAFYWEGAERGEFLGQRCGDCKIFRHPPRPMCPKCQSVHQEIVPLSGRGVVYSYMFPVHPQMPMFEYPLCCVLVDLDEGIRIFSNLYECDRADVKIGIPVEVFFEKTKGDKAVPVFRPAKEATK
jgi:uncharacterized OB-fold protein